ncbi:MAG: SpoIIE family protein phosphatase [Armatimonadetes bacterium]|nr:SpoIIE family protein phosphatase [Armatimonadota bacterium]
MIDTPPHVDTDDATLETAQPATVLIVDDEPDQLITLSFILEEQEGYTALTAETGAQALKAVQDHSVSVALLDIRLPDMTGTELLRAIKDASPETECIMTTGDATFETVQEALNAGASGYFRKPVQTVPLTTAIREQVEKHRLRMRIRKLTEEQRRTIQHLNLLHDLSRTISSTLDVDEVLLMVRNAIIGALGYNRCSIYLVDPETDVIQGRWGTDREGNLKDLSALTLPLNANRPIAQVAREELPFYLSDDMEQYIQDYGEHLRDEVENVRAHAVLPLAAKGRIVGVLTVDNWKDGPPITEEELVDLLPFTYQAAIAIDNARLYKKAQDVSRRESERAADMQMLFQVAQALSYELNLERVMDTVENWVCAAMGTSHFTLFLYNKNFQEFEVRAGAGVDLEQANRAFFDSEDSIGNQVIAEGLRVFDDLHADPDSLLGQLAREADVRSMICVPLRVGEEAIGMIAVYSVRAGAFTSRDDQQLLSTLSSMAASAIRNALRYDKERRIAETMQRELLSPPPEKIGPYGIEHLYQSALDEARVGGDFYDVIELPDGRAAILLADVSGKGLKAAVYTAMGKYMFRGLLMDEPSPGMLLSKLNAALYRYTEPGMFITLFYGLLDPKTGILSYANAGHESPLHYMAEHEFSIALDTTGVVLGVDPDATYVERQIRLSPGDLLLLYTDGLTDARSGDEMLGIDGLQRVLKQMIEENPPKKLNRIYEMARDYASGYLHDDIALIAIEATESAPNPGDDS